MSIEQELQQRCGNKCELCDASKSSNVFAVGPENDGTAAQSIVLCEVCLDKIENPDSADANHWRCLNTSMWSTVPAVQVVVWRMLHQLKGEGWPQDLIDQMYLDDETRLWADAGIDSQGDDGPPTIDSNGTRLLDGDTVTLIKDLAVKGAGFTAKRGTTVKNVSLTSNPLHIEGRVNGTVIVLVAAYLKKA